jgi:hypothetical protein
VTRAIRRHDSFAVRVTFANAGPGERATSWLRAHVAFESERNTGSRRRAIARPGERLEDVGYFAWKGLRLVAEGPSVSEQRRRLAILAEAYGANVDADLLDAIEKAVARLAAKGRAEGWSNEVLTQLREEQAWHRQIRGRLR